MLHCILQLIDHILFPFCHHSDIASSSSHQSSSCPSNLTNSNVIPLWDIDQLIQMILTLQKEPGRLDDEDDIDAADNYSSPTVWDDFVVYVNQVYRTKANSNRNPRDGNRTNWILSQYENRTLGTKEDENSTLVEYLRSVLLTTGKSNVVSWTVDDEKDMKEQIATATRSVRTSSSKQNPNQNRSSSTGKNGANPGNASSGMDEIQRRVNRIRQVVPQYGEGFIETALAYCHGDIEATISLLLLDDDGIKRDWPDILRITDPQLPRTKRDTTTTADYAIDDESKQIAKASIQQYEHQNEQNAYLLHRAMLYDDDDNENHDHDEDNDNDIITTTRYEYDDDYDDQYDDFSATGLIGDNDAGLLDNDNDNNENSASNGNKWNKKKSNNKKKNDIVATSNRSVKKNDEYYDAIHVYNQAMKDIVSDQTYWQQNQNLNHRQSKNHSSNANHNDNNDPLPQPQTRYRGPDKLKGGRIAKYSNQQTNSSNGSLAEDPDHHSASSHHGGRGGRGRQQPQQQQQGRGGRGRGGRDGRGQPAESTSVGTTTHPNGSATTTNGNLPPIKNSRQKERNLAKRRDQQKKSMYNQSG
jgi:hypothetical protein